MQECSQWDSRCKRIVEFFFYYLIKAFPVTTFVLFNAT
jgi:hypothetical protein